MTKPVLTKLVLATALLGGCDLLKPRVDDITIDAAPKLDSSPDAPAPDAAGPQFVLPPGTAVPPVTDNAELASQIQIFDGLSDAALAAAMGVLVRSTGKANGATVRFWSFGSVRFVDGFIGSAPAYVLADDDGTGVLTPRTDHPMLFDSIPGDPAYSPIRRIIYVPVTAAYHGELLTSVAALEEALALGLVRDPVPTGTWRNIPVVASGTKLEVSTGVALPATAVYARGYIVDAFPLGGALGEQPLRNGVPPGGQEDRLLSGVATGTPPSLPATPDAQPVFQYGIPAAPPTTTFNYTPVVTEVDVRLANGVDPTAITSDVQLFKRGATGAISAYYTDTVASYVVTTTVTDKQIQFVDGEP